MSGKVSLPKWKLGGLISVGVLLLAVVIIPYRVVAGIVPRRLLLLLPPVAPGELQRLLGVLVLGSLLMSRCGIERLRARSG